MATYLINQTSTCGVFCAVVPRTYEREGAFVVDSLGAGTIRIIIDRAVIEKWSREINCERLGGLVEKDTRDLRIWNPETRMFATGEDALRITERDQSDDSTSDWKREFAPGGSKHYLAGSVLIDGEDLG